MPSIFTFLSIRAFAITIVLAATGAFMTAHAQSGQVYIVLAKSGKIFSASGSGNLFIHSRRRRLRVTGINIDALPVPILRLTGTVSNLKESAEIAGTYRAAIGGTSVVNSMPARLENRNGVVLELHATELTQGVSIDLSGMTIIGDKAGKPF